MIQTQPDVIIFSWQLRLWLLHFFFLAFMSVYFRHPKQDRWSDLVQIRACELLSQMAPPPAFPGALHCGDLSMLSSVLGIQ